MWQYTAVAGAEIMDKVGAGAPKINNFGSATLLKFLIPNPHGDKKLHPNPQIADPTHSSVLYL